MTEFDVVKRVSPLVNQKTAAATLQAMVNGHIEQQTSIPLQLTSAILFPISLIEISVESLQ